MSPTGSTVVEIGRDGHIATVTLNRAEARNAMNPEMIVRLAQAWADVAADEDVWVVLVTAAPGSTFCAGFDLARYIPLMTGARQAEDEWDRAVIADPGLPGVATLRDFDLGKPLVVAANGHAIAGGMEMALAGDLRVGAAGAKFGLSETRLGLIPAMGGTARLARHVSPAIAAELLLTAEPMSAESALAAGLLNRVVAADEVLGVAMDLARKVASNAPLAVRAARAVLRAATDLTEADALALEARRGAELAATEDAREGPLAFIEKRPPVFKGR